MIIRLVLTSHVRYFPVSMSVFVNVLYQFDVSADNVEVADGDCIGWTNEDINTWISADHCSSDPCQCSGLYNFVTTYDWPVVNKTSAFQCQSYDFSVAVEIQPCRPALQSFTLYVFSIFSNI